MLLLAGLLLGYMLRGSVGDTSSANPIGNDSLVQDNDPVSTEYAQRFAVLESLFDPAWEAKHSDFVALLQDAGVPPQHYRSMFIIALNLSSANESTNQTPIAVLELGPYISCASTFERKQYAPLKVWWKICANNRSPTWLCIDDDRGTCNRRVFDTMTGEWTRFALLYQEPGRAEFHDVGLKAILEVETKAMSDSTPEAEDLRNYSTEKFASHYVYRVEATNVQQLDDWDRVTGWQCRACLRVQLRD